MPTNASETIYIPRRLFSLNEKDERVLHEEVELATQIPPIVILGEPGMGKTSLLKELSTKRADSEFVTAAAVVRRAQKPHQTPSDTTLIIDALDELVAVEEKDPLHNLLKALQILGSPPFILSCRSAEWQGANNILDISEDYGRAPKEWTLEPLSEEDAKNFLHEHGHAKDICSSAITQLNENHLSDFYRNPLTLDLLSTVLTRSKGSLPQNRADLFDQATKLLWSEKNPRLAKSSLAKLSEEDALSSAGAAMAALLITGNEAIVEGSPSMEDQLLLASDVGGLPNASSVSTALRSRLFQTAHGYTDRFIPLHRSIAEYLGARWLAQQVTAGSNVHENKLAQGRLFSLISADGLIPASLRGLHAWLAHWNEDLVESVIQNDPFGLLLYGNTDNLRPNAAEALLIQLQQLEKDDPNFRLSNWSMRPAPGLSGEGMSELLRTILTSQDTRFQLRTLVLQIIKDGPAARVLQSELETLVKCADISFGVRHDAAKALPDITEGEQKQLIDELIQMGDESSARLAITLFIEFGIDKFSPEAIASAALIEMGITATTVVPRSSTIGSSYALREHLPDPFIRTVLNHFTKAARAVSLNSDHNDQHWEVSYSLSSLAAKLIVRQTVIGIDDPINLWDWLYLVGTRGSADQDAIKKISRFCETQDEIRRAIQAHVFFKEETKNSRLGFYKLHDTMFPGLHLQPGDIQILLQSLVHTNTHDERSEEAWHLLVATMRSMDSVPKETQTLAETYAAGYSELERVLDPTPTPQQLEWQKTEEEFQRERQQEKEEEAERRAQDRNNFSAHVEEVRNGDIGWIASPAKAYFGRFYGIDLETPPPDRVGEWLGLENQENILVGFEAILFRDDLPTPEQTAASYAESKYWHSIHPVLAGLAERWKNNQGFNSVPLSVLKVGWMGFWGELLDNEGYFKGFHKNLEQALKTHSGALDETIRLWFEAHLTTKQTHITGLYQLTRAEEYRPYAQKLIPEWLLKFENLSFQTESELVHGLLRAGDAGDGEEIRTLRTVANTHIGSLPDDIERTSLWLSVAFLVGENEEAIFKLLSNHLNRRGPEEAGNLLWAIRDVANYDDWEDHQPRPLSANQLYWVFFTFRSLWPQKSRPNSVTSGNTNGWDACDFLDQIAQRLSADLSDEAQSNLLKLSDAPKDGYTLRLKALFAQQKRARMEANFVSPTITGLSNILNQRTPSTAADVRAVALSEIEEIQKRIRGDATDTVSLFYTDQGKPKTENECRNVFLSLLSNLPYGIQTAPEEAAPNGTRADVGFRLGSIKIPLEAKGQWHNEVWNAANDQLGQFYTKDFQADGNGIYLVFWFGRHAPQGRRLRHPPNSTPAPDTAEEMKHLLEKGLQAGLRGAISIVVLDVSKETSPNG